VADGHCSVRLTRRIAATPEEVWQALTEPDSLRRWLSPHGVEALEPGAELELSLGPEAPVAVRVRELVPGSSLELDWDTGSDPSTVRFELMSDRAGGTVLVLEHGRIDERVGMRYLDRWVTALERLERGLGQ
jgi:uncharacterized protein YndB with AHSA1/START domain